jgi:hypothetical protein
MPTSRGPRRLIPSRSMAVAFVALVATFAGGAYAQTRLPPDSVGRIQIREGSVGTKQVRDGSLQLRDFQRGLIRRGPRGPRGAPGATRVTKQSHSGAEVPAGQIGTASVACPPNTRATGGGGGFAGPPTTNDRVAESIPVGDGPPTRWRITLFNGGQAPRTPVAYAICAAP